MNEELKRLCDEDQRDMTDLPPNRVERDRMRRRRVLEILNEGGATEGIDYTHAAVIFQHGETLDDWWTAHKLAYKASELGFRRARWLSAVALDRWLLRQGKPTKFGTQYVNLGGIIRLARFESSTTDEERKEWDVPSIADSLMLDGEATRGMPNVKVISSLEIPKLKINVVSLSQDVVHSPTFDGEIISYTQDNRPIFRNCQNWNWINKNDGVTMELGWLCIPYVPTIAHILVNKEKVGLKRSILKEEPVIWVIDNTLTLYFKSDEGVWAITGNDCQCIEKVALTLM
ncbi:hypothetical protein PU629_08985 [Pullulanibacillus sp. KACC 23026]|uniref:hypothetical protein n=1 Tax=Pullulanibacillus sp. KACC 23026 TaxID=3028315 RepID=UPI0023B15071|nr:hypothetical protein [Pullulanibacillus sp. KACC 23026]WEG14470.1 hypothetical protein PU629_08985 [Pullulanibacillus sp. KACC 23026]